MATGEEPDLNWWEVQALGMVEPIEIVPGLVACGGCGQEIRAHRLNSEYFGLGSPLDSTRILCDSRKVAPLPYGTSITIYGPSKKSGSDKAVAPLSLL
jgi:hypothetical protein